MKTTENLHAKNTAITTSADEAGYPSGGYGWYVVIVLYLCYTFSFVDRSIITYLVGPIQSDMQINDTYFSLLLGFVLCSLLCFSRHPRGSTGRRKIEAQPSALRCRPVERHDYPLRPCVYILGIVLCPHGRRYR